MKNVNYSAFRVLASWVFLCVAALAQAQALQPSAPPAPVLAAKSYLLLDLSTGSALVDKDSGARVDPASLTKLMTAYVVFNALKQKQIALDQQVPVSPKAWKAIGSRMFIQPGDKVQVEQLLRGMIVQSGNDASIALAEFVSSSEEAFAARMNQTAKALGMTQSSFKNATGLTEPEHYSTALDMAKLASAIIRDFPQFYAYYKEKTFDFGPKTNQENRNRLLWLDPSVDGMKTGHTEAAGYCLVASAQRNGRRLLSVLMGAGSEGARIAESKKLLDFGYNAYDAVLVRKKNDTILTPKVWKGQVNTVDVGVLEDWFASTPRGIGAFAMEFELPGPLVAPLPVGTVVGKVKAVLNGAVYGERPLVVLTAVDEGNWFKRQWHSLMMKFEKKS